MSVAEAKHPEANAQACAGFVPVEVQVLRCIGEVNVDLFLFDRSRNAAVLYRGAGYALSDKQIQQLEAEGEHQLLVKSGDFNSLSGDLLDSLEGVLQKDTVPPDQRFAVLQLAVAAEVDRTLKMIDCGKFVALADRIGRGLADLLTSGKSLPRSMFRMARHDFFTFTHVTNVSCYAVLLAERLGGYDEQEIQQIAIGGMLHDIGKRHIAAAILQKSSRLSDDERDVVESHPRRGYEELCRREDISHGQLMMVYQHHEHADGRGYPVGILEDEIHPWAKLLAVVDVFDAMTGKRPYRRAAPASAVLEYLERRAGTQFDAEIVKCWITAMQES